MAIIKLGYVVRGNDYYCVCHLFVCIVRPLTDPTETGLYSGPIAVIILWRCTNFSVWKYRNF